MQQKIVGVLLFLVGILLLGRCSSVHEAEKKSLEIEDEETSLINTNKPRYSYSEFKESLQKEKKILYPKESGSKIQDKLSSSSNIYKHT